MTSPTSYHSLSAARQLHVEGRSDDANFSPATSAINVTDSNRFATANTRADSPVSMLSDQEVSMVWQHDAQPDAVMNPKTLGPHHEPQQAGWWSKLVADTWTLELVAGFISFAAISSIIGLLWGYDNKPVPPLMKGITLNAVISFLATISRTAIMLCIGTVLSQGKWLWFKRERSLVDLQNIESASRGPFGSLLLLFRARGGITCSIAALLTLATLGFDPFVQQLLTTQTRVVTEPADGVFINAATTTLPSEAMVYPETTAQIAAAMLLDIQQYQDSSRTRVKRSNSSGLAPSTPLHPQCPSGNCMWQPYYALDICTSCRSTTEEVVFRNLTYSGWVSANADCNYPRGSCYNPYSGTMVANWTWEIKPRYGNGWIVTSSATTFSSVGAQMATTDITIGRKVVWPLNFEVLDDGSWNTSVRTPQSFAGIHVPVASIGFAEFEVDEFVPKLNRSLECALTYCVKQFNRTVTQGVLESDVVSTHYGSVTGNSTESRGSGLLWSTIVNGTNFSSSSIGYGAIATMVDFLLGNATHVYNGGCGINQPDCLPKQVDNAGIYASHADAWQGIDLTEDFSALLKNTESMMSQIIQQYGNDSILGDNTVSKQFVIVRWPWITLPATIVLLGLLILVLTVLESWRSQAPSWKSSLLPLLYRYSAVDDNRPIPQSDSKAPTAIGEKPAAEDELANSNNVSKFELEAEATVTHFFGKPAAGQVWQLQSLHVMHGTKDKWWQRLKLW